MCFVSLMTGTHSFLFGTLEFNCSSINIWEFVVMRALSFDTVKAFKVLHLQLICSLLTCSLLFQCFVLLCSQVLAVVSMRMEPVMVTG